MGLGVEEVRVVAVSLCVGFKYFYYNIIYNKNI